MEVKSVVVFGAGRFGTSIAQELFKNDVEVMVIDKDEDKIQNLATKVTTAIIADVTDEAAMEEVGLKNFDVAVVAIGSDMESSIIATVTAKEHGISTIYAKSPTDMHGRILSKIGADYIIYPEKQIAERLARSISGSSIVEYLNFSEEYSIAELTPPKNWENKTLAKLDIRNEKNIMIIAIKRNKQTIISPKANEIILKNDKVIVLCKNEEIEELAEHVKH